MMASAEQMPMVSYWASSPTLSDQTAYATFGRSFPSDATHAGLLMRLLFEGFKGWKNVALVHESSQWGEGYAWAMISMHEQLRDLGVLHGTRLVAYPFTIHGGVPDEQNLGLALDGVLASGCSVIVAGALGGSLPSLLEQAAQRGLINAKHAWFIPYGRSWLGELAALQPVKRRERLSDLLSGMQSLEVTVTHQSGFDRFAAAWREMRPTDCTNPLFQPSAELFESAPWDQSYAAHSPSLSLDSLLTHSRASASRAFIFDCVASLALAIDGARAAADGEGGPGARGVSGQQIFENLLSVRMAGASGAFALDANGDRDAATVAYLYANLGLTPRTSRLATLELPLTRLGPIGTDWRASGRRCRGSAARAGARRARTY